MDCNSEISRVDFTFAAPATLTLTEKICINRTAFEQLDSGWLVGCFGFETVFQSEREKAERNDR